MPQQHLRAMFMGLDLMSCCLVKYGSQGAFQSRLQSQQLQDIRGNVLHVCKQCPFCATLFFVGIVVQGHLNGFFKSEIDCL